MNNQLMTFSSEELNFSMSGILYEGKPAFDAVELAKSLGYTNPAKALKDHCKALIKLDYNESLELGFGEKPRGTQLAGQADLFRLILRSQLPSAERVQDWVCEDVLPSIMTTGTYSKEVPSANPHQQEISMNHDILSLARVVAEATASATMKAVMEVSGTNLIAAAPASPAGQPTTVGAGAGFVNTDSEFEPVHKVSWETGLSDPSCRRLVQFANLPARQLPGVRGLCVHRESFLHAFQVLLEESVRPSGKRKRWQHPKFGGFILRKDPKEIPGESD
ncbi:BRO-N domain-containing protein [Enterobacter hormaechei]|uniref:BRO-N domain-containing protein n=1 Tax=Enterobacter hormaechei TaxID=158836 RepID=UPI003F8AAAA1